MQHICLNTGFLLCAAFWWGGARWGRWGNEKESSFVNLTLFCCLGRIRTLTGGTRIRRATITPQGRLFLFYGCKFKDFFNTIQIFLRIFVDMDEFIFKIKDEIASRSLIERRGNDAADVIVALSGGADSVALLIVLNELGYRCVAAHCNFHLRGEESDRDMDYAEQIAAMYAYDFRCIHFDVKNYKKKYGVSTEMACRDLRYDWFRRLSDEYGGIPVAVAHHRDDNEETMFLNLLRGTGLTGLCGMRPKNGIFVRPLLTVGRDDIEKFLNGRAIPFVVDSSNLENDVKRNRLRNVVLPAIRNQFHDADAGIAHTISDLNRNRSLYEEAIGILGRKYIDGAGRILVSLMVEEMENADMLLYELIKGSGFSYLQACDVVKDSLSSGRRFYSRTHEMIIDRGKLIVEARTEMDDDCEIRFSINRDGGTLPDGFTVKFIERGEMRPDRACRTIYMDASVLDAVPEFVLRGWRKADRIQPYGMRGSRLVSDIMTDAKVPLNEKRRVRILEADGVILWVVGLRASRHYPVIDDTKTVLCISWTGAPE